MADDVGELEQRLARIRVYASELTGTLADLYLVAHDRTSSDGPKVANTVEGFTQLASHRRAQRAWKETRDLVRHTELTLRASLTQVQRILGEGEPVDSRYRPGRPITDAELELALVNQGKRAARGEYQPMRSYPQPGPVRR